MAILSRLKRSTRSRILVVVGALVFLVGTAATPTLTTLPATANSAASPAPADSARLGELRNGVDAPARVVASPTALSLAQGGLTPTPSATFPAATFPSAAPALVSTATSLPLPANPGPAAAPNTFFNPLALLGGPTPGSTANPTQAAKTATSGPGTVAQFAAVSTSGATSGSAGYVLPTLSVLQATATASQTSVWTSTPTRTSIFIPSPTRSYTRTSTRTVTPTRTETRTPTATGTATSTPTATQTSIITETTTSTATATPTATATVTDQATNTATPTPTPTETATVTEQATNTATPTPTPTGTATTTLPAIDFTVNTTVDAVDAVPGDGLCVSPLGNCSLRAAVQEANALGGDKTIYIPAGLYVLTLPGAGEDAGLTGDLDISANLVIMGAGKTTTKIDASQLGDRVLQIGVASATVQISGIAIQNGNLSAGDGGGIFNAGTLILSDSDVVSNTAAAGQGGGLFTGAGGVTTLDHATVSGNQAESGGGLAAGGTAAEVAMLKVSASAILSNTARSQALGAALDHAAGDFTNVTISGHLSGTLPAVWAGPASTLTLTQITLANNFAGIASLTGTVYLKNSLLATNASGNCLGPITSLGHNLDDDATCQLTASGDLTRIAPLLDVLGAYGGQTQTHRLQAASAARDAGDNAGCPAYDQRDIARPQNGLCDIGAVEYTPLLDP